MASRYSNPLDAKSHVGEFRSYMHPDYNYYLPEWIMIRDAIAGERRIKEKGTEYLPSLDVEYGTAYAVYKDRAVYVNMVARSVLGMVGTVFRRPLKVDNTPKENIESVTLGGMDLNTFAKKLAYELCSVGRVGVLVDMSDERRPYMTEYVAENILSWRTKVVNGREVLTYVLLREIVDDTPILDGKSSVPSAVSLASQAQTGGLRARYRVLILDNGVYRQRLFQFAPDNTTQSLASAQFEEVTPTRNGMPFDYIPMVIFGPMSATPEVQKSPIYDITTLNIAHYRTSAQLEHGRYYTALPVYYVAATAGQESEDYHVGPSVVWEVPPDTKPGILEYYGTGLKSLADSLVEKEEHIAQLGGRIMGIRPAATAESDNIYMLKQANEMSILLNITDSLSNGLTRLMVWYLDWARRPTKGVRVRLNQDFKALQIAARELRAVALLYQEGIIPIQSIFEILQGAEFISEDLTLDEFTALLDNSQNFPNQPDVEARMEGYPDARSRQNDEVSLRQQNAADAQREMDREHQLLMDRRRESQQEDLQSVMFEQGRRTSQYEHALAKDMETHKSKLKREEAKSAPKAAPKAGVPTKKNSARK